MPQIYSRRLSTPTPTPTPPLPPARPPFEFVGGNGNANPQRPYVSRRASGIPASPPPPPPWQSTPVAITDADDSMVLSDLIRTGETSRLRRRGAMRLDHAARPPPASLGYGGDDEYAYGGQEWREWASDAGAAAGAGPLGPGGVQLDDMRHSGKHTSSEPAFRLFCGATVPAPSSHQQPFTPSPLPSTSFHESPSHDAPPYTNGCGALVHLRSFSQSPRPVWVGKEEATEVVVSLDAQYFDSAVVAKMMKSACGCLREGIGCAVCGNPLGTRYMPCQAASEGIFSQPPSRSPRQKRRTSRGSVSGTRDANHFYVYTFFADHVSSELAHEPLHYPPMRAPTAASTTSPPQPVPQAPRRSRSPPSGPDSLERVAPPSPTLFTFDEPSDRQRRSLPPSFLAITPQESEASRIFTASPRPLTPPLPLSPSIVQSPSPTGADRADVPPPIRLLEDSPAPRSRVLEDEFDMRMRQVQGEEVVLDADGVVVVEDEDEAAEGDKVVGETVAWGGR